MSTPCAAPGATWYIATCSASRRVREPTQYRIGRWATERHVSRKRRRIAVLDPLLQAAKASREKLATNIGFLGQDQTPLDTYLDIALHIPSSDTQRVQEAHLLCGHILIHLIETELLISK